MPLTRHETTCFEAFVHVFVLKHFSMSQILTQTARGQFSRGFMGVLGEILKCFKPDDCDVTHDDEPNILHIFCRSQHMLCSDTTNTHTFVLIYRKKQRHNISLR